MIHKQHIVIISLLLFLNSCVSQFIPHTDEDKDILVVEGLITDQPDTYTIKLSKSLRLGEKIVDNPVQGCSVTVSDDLGNSFSLTENHPGIYQTDPVIFQGIVGRSYTLHISTNNPFNNFTYESFPMEMKPVPAIDSVYYEKLTLKEINGASAQEGCQVYLSTHDPSDKCKFYRWEYSETWEFHLPYSVPNRVCWLSSNSSVINIKNTSTLGEDKITQYPLNFISNETDRLQTKYSILVNQYSLNEDEYQYWEKLQNFSEQVGGLYDMIPSAVSSNVYCIDNANVKVLGYFSVSASSSKRIFIKDRFAGIVNLYDTDACVDDTIFGGQNIPNLNVSTWIIYNNFIPYYNVITYSKGCYDCRVRGTNIPPDFWNDSK